MDEQSEANKQRAAFMADAPLAEEKILSEGLGYDAEEVNRYICGPIAGKNRNAPKQSLGDDRSRQLGLLSGRAGVCFGDDFAMTEEELVDL